MVNNELFPPEIILHVIQFLNFREISSLSLTCRKMRSICQDITLSYKTFQPQLFDNIPKTIHTHSSWSHILRNAQHLDFSKCPLSDIQLVAVSNVFSSIRSVNLANSIEVTPKSLQEFLSNQQNVTSLNLTKCCWISDESIFDICTHLPHLRDLNLSYTCVTDYGLELLADSNLKLISLSIAPCLLVTEFCCIALQRITHRGLEKLSMCSMSFVDFDFLSNLLYSTNGALRFVDITFCETITKSDIHQLIQCNPRVEIRNNCILQDYSTESIKKYLSFILNLCNEGKIIEQQIIDQLSHEQQPIP